MEWVKVSDCLPDSERQVLVFGPCGIELVFYNNYHKCWDDKDQEDFYKKIEYFTHWMNLPEKPNDCIINR